MPAYHVFRSTHIQASPQQVFDTASDFNTWSTWSPWLCMEKQAKVVVTQDSNSVGSKYEWTGELVGQGEIEHTKLDPPGFIEERLLFLKPFKSQARVTFDIEPAGDGTKVTWHMYGSLPWFMFWMAGQMDTFIGMDYERGLKMLKELIETGQVQSDIDIQGVKPMPAHTVVGVRSSCSFDQICESMRNAFQQAEDAIAKQNLSREGEALSIYHVWDLKNKRCEYTAGYVMPTTAPAVAAPLSQVAIPATNSLTIRHTGRYEHLGNAWSSGFQYARHKKLKLSKQVHPYEIYRNNSEETPTSEMISDVYLPLK